MILFIILHVLFFAVSFALGFCVCLDLVMPDNDLIRKVADDEGEDLMKPLDSGSVQE